MIKKIVLLGTSLLVAGAIFAENSTDPLKLEEFYAQKISSNGVWLYSNTGEETVIYNLSTHQYNVFESVGLGNGNPIALDGTAVGLSEGGGTIIKGDEAIIPSPLSRYGYSNINGITGDGHRVTGVISYSGGIGMDEFNQMYLPFVFDIDEAGNYSDLIFLPHPDKDFFGLVPQYCSATWISDDGKVVLGQMVDSSGMSIQPIVYTQGEDGEWSYSLPTESIFNPNHIELPEYPGEFDYDREPNVLDYMSPEDRENFIEDMDWWQTEGNFNEELYPGNYLEDYMTDEEYEKYNEALNDYIDYYYDYMSKISPYISARNEIIATSPSFLQNGGCLNKEGTLAALTNMIDKEISAGVVERTYGTYLLDVTTNSLSQIKSGTANVQALQVLDGGVVLGSVPPQDGVQESYVYVPGSEGYVPVEEYLAATNPYAAKWMQDNLVHEVISGGGGVAPLSGNVIPLDENGMMISGNGVASADFSVFASGVPAYIFDEELIYFTYVFTGLSTGVKMISADESSVKVLQGGVLEIKGEITDMSIVDLSGRKMFALPNAEGSVSTGLSRGIYVVVYNDARGQRVSQKVRL